jgi:DNA repair protein RadC
MTMKHKQSQTAKEHKTMYRLTQYKVSLVRDSAEMKEGDKRISSVDDVVSAMSDMKLLDREQLRCIFLDCRNKIIGWEVVSQGSLTASIAHPREILKGAILSNAAAIILVHNHPSGECAPSDEDIRLTQRIKQAGEIMGIRLQDHVIIAEKGSYSFQRSGQIA